MAICEATPIASKGQTTRHTRQLMKRYRSLCHTAVQRWRRKTEHGDKWKLCTNETGEQPGKAEGP